MMRMMMMMMMMMMGLGPTSGPMLAPLFLNGCGIDFLMVVQMRRELEEAGLGPERVELLFDLYEQARSEKEQRQEAPAAPLAEADEAEPSSNPPKEASRETFQSFRF
jgi:hypothetical protein